MKVTISKACTTKTILSPGSSAMDEEELIHNAKPITIKPRKEKKNQVACISVIDIT